MPYFMFLIQPLMKMFRLFIYSVTDSEPVMKMTSRRRKYSQKIYWRYVYKYSDIEAYCILRTLFSEGITFAAQCARTNSHAVH